MNSGPLGDAEMTFVISGGGTALVEKSKYGTSNWPGHVEGNSVKFQGGAFHEISWKITPNADGKSALVQADRPFIGHRSAVFRRTSE